MPSCFDSRFSAIKLTLKSIFASFISPSDSFFVFYFLQVGVFFEVYIICLWIDQVSQYSVLVIKKINQSKHHYSYGLDLHVCNICGIPYVWTCSIVGWCSLLVDEITCSPFIHVLLALQAQSDEICWEKYARFQFSFKYLYLLAKLDHKLEGKKTRGVKRLSEWQNVHLWVSQIFIFISYK